MKIMLYHLSIYIAIVIPVLSYDIDSRSFQVCVPKCVFASEPCICPPL